MQTGYLIKVIGYWDFCLGLAEFIKQMCRAGQIMEDIWPHQ
jgi:hypothetical protein